MGLHGRQCGKENAARSAFEDDSRHVSDVTVLVAPAIPRVQSGHVPDTVLCRSILYRTVRYIPNSDRNATKAYIDSLTSIKPQKCADA